LRKLAEGASFFEAKDGDTIRPMVDVSWAPILGAFSVLFESEQDDSFIDTCIEGFRVSIALVSGLEMYMLRSAFLSSLMQFTSLNAPSRISDKHVKAFRHVNHCVFFIIHGDVFFA
jgi:brefeldin A-inhibited guanine nucleotide-exchange protein